jgi:hypothetical protein
MLLLYRSETRPGHLLHGLLTSGANRAGAPQRRTRDLCLFRTAAPPVKDRAHNDRCIKSSNHLAKPALTNRRRRASGRYNRQGRREGSHASAKHREERRAAPRGDLHMGDIIFVLATLAFFGLCWLYVRGCELLIKSSEESPESIEPTP